MSQITRATLPAESPFGSTRNVSRSGRSTMSDSSIRTKPSMDEPSNMMSPSSAFSNWLSGTSTFLLTPRMSVNCRRRELTSCFLAASRISFLVDIDRDAKGTAIKLPSLQCVSLGSRVVVEEELVRVRPQGHRVDVLDSLHLQPGVDEVLREHSAVEQERVVGLQSLQRLEETSRRVLDVLPLFRLQLVQIHVHRLRR